ncbi:MULTISPECIES: helix-turn-helix transcriptional regulator [Streptomyces]|uniref:helix-turn-helix transcriptional regulator n=1 Tax=Streptomyces TaxID=1883 RepID=UPI0013712B2A|nr:helix-turn-helix domain-containing protein [Streptomyces sp. SID2888]MYV49364.1 helix-turn-helix domain-containing protein [Streptomyces sp. SID2888]
MVASRQLTDPGNAPVQRGRRAAVLQLLRESGTPLGAAEVAERVGVHLNTARFHLDALVSEELAVRGTAPREEPGRPKVVYSAVAAEGPEGARSFRLLSDILLGVVAGAVDDPVAAATEAGRSWGAYLTDAPAPTERIGAEEGQRRLRATLEGMGFVTEAEAPAGEPADEPAAGVSEGGAGGGAEDAEGIRRLRLHHCPFREVAQRRPDIICAVHLGLMRGTVDTLRAPLTAESLEPFVTPHLCVATLRRTDLPTDRDVRDGPSAQQGPV